MTSSQPSSVEVLLRLLDQRRQRGDGHADVGRPALVVRLEGHRAPEGNLASLPKLIGVRLCSLERVHRRDCQKL